MYVPPSWHITNKTRVGLIAKYCTVYIVLYSGLTVTINEEDLGLHSEPSKAYLLKGGAGAQLLMREIATFRSLIVPSVKVEFKVV